MTTDQAFKATTGLTIEEGVEKAIEGGWINTREDEVACDYLEHENVIFLDPAFWQSLSKAMGWRELYRDRHSDIEVHINAEDGFFTNWGKENGITATPAWLYKMHLFIDHLTQPVADKETKTE